MSSIAPDPRIREIGRSRPRAEARRLLAGGGRYAGDENRQGQLHACFLRSPYPRAAIASIDREAAIAHPGVAAVLSWEDLAPVCKPWRTVSTAFPGLQAQIGYLTDVLTRIVNGYLNSRIDELLPWAYIRSDDLKAVA